MSLSVSHFTIMFVLLLIALQGRNQDYNDFNLQFAIDVSNVGVFIDRFPPLLRP